MGGLATYVSGETGVQVRASIVVVRNHVGVSAQAARELYPHGVIMWKDRGVGVSPVRARLRNQCPNNEYGRGRNGGRDSGCSGPPERHSEMMPQ